MAEKIVAAVRLKRKVLEGVEQQLDIDAILLKYTRKLLFAKPGRETARIKRELVDLMRMKYFPLADKSGRKSAIPILEKVGGSAAVERASTLYGDPLRFLSGYRQRNIAWFTQEVNTGTTALSSELQAQIARAYRDGVSQQRMITDVIGSYEAELKQIKKARKRLSVANTALANAEATADVDAIAIARAERKLAMAATRDVNTAMGRLENRVQAAARDSVRREAQRAQLASYRQAGYTVFTWVAVNGSLACPSCTDLHGQTRKMVDWHGNQPGDGHTFCLDSCVCELVPQEFAEGNESIRGPVNPYLIPEFFE